MNTNQQVTFIDGVIRLTTEQAPAGCKWVVVDGRTGAIVGKPYASRNRARSRADKLDLAYGAYRYRVEVAK